MEPTHPITAAEIIARAKEAGLIRDAGDQFAIQKQAGQLAIEYNKVQMMVMAVTPAMAAEWLERNTRNRPISKHTVTAYARDMRAGNWLVTHQGIAFNRRDELVDGQHRLHAIIEANVTLWTLVTFGLPSGKLKHGMTVMDTVDRGRPRSVADQLKVQHGMKHGTVLAAICSSIASTIVGTRTTRMSVGQVLEIYQLWQPGIDHVIRFRPKTHGLKMAGVLAGFALASMADAEALAWFTRLVTGQTVPDSPLGQLQAFLCSDDAILLNRSADRGLIELVSPAIEHQLAGDASWTLARDPEAVQRILRAHPEGVTRVEKIFR